MCPKPIRIEIKVTVEGDKAAGWPNYIRGSSGMYYVIDDLLNSKSLVVIAADILNVAMKAMQEVAQGAQ